MEKLYASMSCKWTVSIFLVCVPIDFYKGVIRCQVLPKTFLHNVPKLIGMVYREKCKGDSKYNITYVVYTYIVIASLPPLNKNDVELIIMRKVQFGR